MRILKAVDTDCARIVLSSAYQLRIFQLQLSTGFNIFRINKNAFNRTNLYTLRHLEVPHALGAQLWRDVIELGTRIDCPIWAYGLANIAVHALVGDKEGHRSKTKTITWSLSPIRCRYQHL